MAQAQAPLVHNTRFDTYPMLTHASGKAEQLPLWPSLLRAAEAWRIDARLDPNVTVITFNNGGTFEHSGKRLGLFEESLRRSRIQEITVLGGGVTTNWKNSLKIGLLLNHLDTGRVRDYVLVADSADVILTNDLRPLVELFKTFNCRAVFNGERKHWPADLPPFDEQVATGEFFPCLNSGVWVADASFARELAAHCAALSVDKHGKSDQVRYKMAYRHFYPQMRVDHRCVLFQNINRVEADIVAVREQEASPSGPLAWTKHLGRLFGR